MADAGAGGAKQKKRALAIKDKDATTNDEVEPEPEPSPKKAKKGADPEHAEEAELLSDIGASSNKDIAKKMVLKMVALLEKVEKDSKVDCSTPKGKKLLDCLQELKKLQKTGAKLNVETARQQLFEGALAVKRIKERAQALFWSKMAALIARPICTWDVRGFAAVSVSESCVERFLIHLLQLRPFSAELSFCSCKSLE